MESIVFNCELITPLFMSGADGITPELRAPSIKGAMRYWWRAMHGDKDLKTLQELEGQIFGDTKQRSKVIVIVGEQPVTINDNDMLPHKENPNHRSPKKSYKNSTMLNIKLKMNSEIKLSNGNIFTLIQLKDLFILVATFGGLGKRSRRGMGSFKVLKEKMPLSVEEILTKIKTVNAHFSYTSVSNYPTIQKIEIGKNIKTPNQIGTATHNEKLEDSSSNKSAYESTIGAGRPRFASPIYISVLENGLPIITTLKTISPNQRNLQMGIQQTLKEKIL